MLQFFLIRVSVVSDVAFVLQLSVPHLFFVSVPRDDGVFPTVAFPKYLHFYS